MMAGVFLQKNVKLFRKRRLGDDGGWEIKKSENTVDEFTIHIGDSKELLFNELYIKLY